MNNEDFDCMTDEELKYVQEKINAALMTLRQAARRINEDTLKNEVYSKLLTLSIDLDIEITTRKEHSNENI